MSTDPKDQCKTCRHIETPSQKWCQMWSTPPVRLCPLYIYKNFDEPVSDDTERCPNTGDFESTPEISPSAAEQASEVRGLYPSAVTRATWQSCADAAGLPLNQWLERAANAQVKRDLRKGK